MFNRNLFLVKLLVLMLVSSCHQDDMIGEISISNLPTALTFRDCENAKEELKIGMQNVGDQEIQNLQAKINYFNEQEGWLVVDYVPTLLPDSLGISIDVTDLPIGNYEAEVVLTADNLKQDEVRIPILINVLPVSSAAKARFLFEFVGTNIPTNQSISYGVTQRICQAQAPICTRISGQGFLANGISLFETCLFSGSSYTYSFSPTASNCKAEILNYSLDFSSGEVQTYNVVFICN